MILQIDFNIFPKQINLYFHLFPLVVFSYGIYIVVCRVKANSDESAKSIPSNHVDDQAIIDEDDASDELQRALEKSVESNLI